MNQIFRMIFMFLTLTIGGCERRCYDTVTVAQTGIWGGVVCDSHSVASYKETEHGLVLLCNCKSN